MTKSTEVITLKVQLLLVKIDLQRTLQEWEWKNATNMPTEMHTTLERALVEVEDEIARLKLLQPLLS